MANCRLTVLLKRMRVRLALVRGLQGLVLMTMFAAWGCSLPWAKKDTAEPDKKSSAAATKNEKSPNQYIPAEFLK